MPIANKICYKCKETKTEDLFTKELHKNRANYGKPSWEDVQHGGLELSIKSKLGTNS